MASAVVDSIETHRDILECVCDAVLKLDEARGIAASEFGDTDPRTRQIESVWAESYSLRQWALESIDALQTTLQRANAGEAQAPSHTPEEPQHKGNKP